MLLLYKNQYKAIKKVFFKLIKKSLSLQGADGIEYLQIPVDAGTLTDFLEKEDVE